MEFFLHIIVLIAIVFPASLAFNLVFGKAKIFQFGPVAVSVVSVYAFVLTLVATNSFLLALLCSLVCTSLLSAVFSWLSLRLEPDGLGVMTIAMHLSMIAVALNWNSLTRGALGIPGIPTLPFLNSTLNVAIFGAIICLISYLLVRTIDRSPLGRQITALSEDKWYATSLGISRATVHYIVFLVAGFIITIGNTVYVQYLAFLHPNDYLFPSFVFILTAVVAGGLGSVRGTVVATILLVLLRESLRFLPLTPSVVGPVRLLLFGLILFIAVWIRRDTLFPHQRKF